MVFYNILMILTTVFFIPCLMGLTLYKDKEAVTLLWIKGLLMEWACILVCALPFIILEKSIDYVIYACISLCGLLSILGLIAFFVRKKKGLVAMLEPLTAKLSKAEIIYLALFLGIVGFQLYKAIFYMYADGDDAYYVATATVAASAESMYIKDPYMGINVPVNYRYALAPFPIWIAVISRISKVPVAILAHSILSPILIVTTYFIYNEISKEIFSDREKRYMFLTLISVFIMFENVSTSTQGSFLLTRARQGKEALANIILPMFFLYILKLLKGRLNIKMVEWLELFVLAIAASLTSMLGNALSGICVLFLCIVIIIKEKSLKKALLIGLTVLPSVAMVGLYAWLR